MDVSFVVVIGMPVLYLTGSLRKQVEQMRVKGFAFLLYFIITAAFSLLPYVKILQGLRISISGAFFCLAPAIFLAVHKRYTYKHYLAFVLSTLAGVTASFFSNIYTMPYLPYLAGFLTSVTAALLFKMEGPVFAPIMIGAYGISGCMMQMIEGTGGYITMFGNLGTASVSAVVCFFAAYLLGRPWSRHTAGSAIPPQET